MAEGQVSNKYSTPFSLVNVLYKNVTTDTAPQGWSSEATSYGLDPGNWSSSQAATPGSPSGFNLIDAIKIFGSFEKHMNSQIGYVSGRPNF